MLFSQRVSINARSFLEGSTEFQKKLIRLSRVNLKSSIDHCTEELSSRERTFQRPCQIELQSKVVPPTTLDHSCSATAWVLLVIDCNLQKNSGLGDRESEKKGGIGDRLQFAKKLVIRCNL